MPLLVIEWNGKSLCVKDWAKYLGCSPSCISSRLKKYRNKYGLDKVFDLDWNPKLNYVKKLHGKEEDVIKLRKEGHTLTSISTKMNCSYSTIYKFLIKNYDKRFTR